MVERSDRMWPTGEGNGKALQYSCLENSMNSMRRQNDRTLKEELPRLVGAQYATGDQWRNNSRKNEGMEPKKKQNKEKKNTFVYFLTILHIWSVFLHVFTSLQGLPLAAIGDMLRLLNTGGAKVVDPWGCLYTS